MTHKIGNIVFIEGEQDDICEVCSAVDELRPYGSFDKDKGRRLRICFDCMQPHQERVVTEKNELDEKLDKLKAFIEENPIFKTLPHDEQLRLNRQFDAMAEYSHILGQRIDAFSGGVR